MIRLGGGGGREARLCHVGWAFYQVVCPRGAAMLSALKTPSSMEPCRPTMESSVTQSAAGQRAPSPYQRAGIFSAPSNGFNRGEVATGGREELGGGGVKQG